MHISDKISSDSNDTSAAGVFTLPTMPGINPSAFMQAIGACGENFTKELQGGGKQSHNSPQAPIALQQNELRLAFRLYELTRERVIGISQSTLIFSIARKVASEVFEPASLLDGPAAPSDRGAEPAQVIGNLAQICSDHGERDLAETLWKEALRLGRAGSSYAAVAEYAGRLGECLLFRGSLDQAEEFLLEAHSAKTELLDYYSPAIVNSLQSLAELYFKKGAYGKSSNFCREAVSIASAIFGTIHPLVGLANHNLGLCFYKLGLYELAEARFAEALKSYRVNFAPDHPQLALLMAIRAKARGNLIEHESECTQPMSVGLT